MIIYTVKSGDTLYNIARRFGVTVGELERFNGLPDANQLVIGQDVLIPVPGTLHTVTAGESLYSIAIRHDVSLNALINANPDITPPYIIVPGQIINVPKSTTPKKTIAVNGYAYPDINRSVLQKTLPYLSYLSIFSYSVDTDGNLGSIDDDELISIALKDGTKPVMVITNTEAGGGFRSEITQVVLNNQNIRNTLINNIINKATSKGYRGVDVDFEYIYPEDRDNYNDFLRILGERLHAEGLTLSTAIAPKISATQQGTLYEAHDYAFHGSVVDYTVIMTYEWGYLYGPPMAVAPYNEVRKVISYAVTEIPPEKILMGMPNYSYDWTLPYVEGRAARILSINEAIRRAANEGAQIQYNLDSEAPFYEYTRNDVRHIVWFENARSTAARLNIVKDFNLKGVSYWTVNQFYEQNWRVLNNMFNIEKFYD